MNSLKEAIKLVFVFVVFFALLELGSYAVLRSMGINPFNKHSADVYGRKINGYYVTQNSPNHTFKAFDGLDNFKKGKLLTDSNSLVSDALVQLKKEEGSIRIFITGGSTAFGSIQNKLAGDNTYPNGSYTYNSSIAGILKAKLSEKFPDKKFEVVNAAVVQHKFHQNYLMYLALLHNFKPDMIINIDGFNDGDVISLGKQFDSYTIKIELEKLLELEAKNRQSRFPLTVYLANLLLDKYTDRLTQLPPKSSTITGGFEEPLLADYKIIEPQFIENSKDLLWLINAYEAQLKADSVYSVFCLQPMLSRRGHQKQLSALETKIRGNIEKNIESRAALFESELGKGSSALLDSGYFKLSGSKRYAVESYLHAYFFDEYFSARVDSIVKGYGGSYIDINQQIINLKASDEFYVDYCHLSPFGNQFVAQQLVNEVGEYIKKHPNH